MIFTSIWIGVLAYSIIIGVAIAWIGISLANWMTYHTRCTLLLAGGALAFAVYFSSVLVIASDWFPGFSGPYVALGVRVTALLGALAMLGVTAIYLNRKRRQEPC